MASKPKKRKYANEVRITIENFQGGKPMGKSLVLSYEKGDVQISMHRKLLPIYKGKKVVGYKDGGKATSIIAFEVADPPVALPNE